MIKGISVTNKERSYELDSLKAIAILIVFTTHFFADIFPAGFDYINKLPLSILFFGVTGKFGVAILAVLNGYFAYRKGTKDKNNSIYYLIDRYIFFFIWCLITNLIYVYIFKLYGTDFSLYALVKKSVILSEDIFLMLWFVKEFFFGSLLCYMLGKKNIDIDFVLILFLIFVFIDYVWVAICVMGYIVAYFIDNPEKIHADINKKVRITMFVVSFILIKQGDENSIVYLIYGLSVVLLLLVVLNSKTAHKMLSIKCMSYCGRLTMPILVLHDGILKIIGKFIIYRTSSVLLCFIICLVITLALSFILDIIFRTIFSGCKKVVHQIIELLESKLNHFLHNI